MPPIEEHDLIHDAILYRKFGVDPYGNATYSAPEQIACRWKWTNRSMAESDGQNNGVDVSIVVALDVAVPIDSLLWRGTFVEASEAGYGTGTGGDGPSSDLVRVVSNGETSDLKGRFGRQMLTASAYKDLSPVTP